MEPQLAQWQDNVADDRVQLERTYVGDLDTDGKTEVTIGRMCEHIRKSADDDQVKAAANWAHESFGGGSSDPAMKAWAVFWFCKHYVRFVVDEAPMFRLNEPNQQDLLYSPAVLIRMQDPAGDCDDFTMMGAALLKALGVPFVIVTIAAGPDDPQRWSHVFLMAMLSTGPLPIDASHGSGPGWMVPASHTYRWQCWDEDGKPVERPAATETWTERLGSKRTGAGSGEQHHRHAHRHIVTSDVFSEQRESVCATHHQHYVASSFQRPELQPDVFPQQPDQRRGWHSPILQQRSTTAANVVDGPRSQRNAVEHVRQHHAVSDDRPWRLSARDAGEEQMIPMRIELPFPVPMRSRRGFGQSEPIPGQTPVEGYNPLTTASGITKAVTGSIGASMLAAAPFTGPAAPFVAAGGALLELISAASALYSGCGVTCVEATNIVNQVEPYLIQNNQLYFSNPNRTNCDQQAALNTFDTIWSGVVQGCSAPNLGTAGSDCINERSAEALHCTWGKTQPNTYPPYCSVPYPLGVCWNWFLAYRDPIANDVPPGGACPIGSVLGGGASSLLSSVGISPGATFFGIPMDTLFIGGGLLFGAWLLAGEL